MSLSIPPRAKYNFSLPTWANQGGMRGSSKSVHRLPSTISLAWACLLDVLDEPEDTTFCSSKIVSLLIFSSAIACRYLFPEGLECIILSRVPANADSWLKQTLKTSSSLVALICNLWKYNHSSCITLVKLWTYKILRKNWLAKFFTSHVGINSIIIQKWGSSNNIQENREGGW